MVARFKPSTGVRNFALTALLILLAVFTLTDLPLALDAEEQALKDLTPTEIVTIFAEKLGTKTDESPGVVAAELSRIYEANQDEAEEIRKVLLARAERAAAEGDGELAGVLTKMFHVLVQEEGLDPAPPLPSVARTKATVKVLRQAGTAMYSRFSVPEEVSQPAMPKKKAKVKPAQSAKPAPALEPKMASWSDCSPISTSEIRKLADEQGWGPLPAFDGWGHNLEYCLDEGLLEGAAQVNLFGFGVRSPGMDGVFSGEDYAVGGFDPAETPETDLVWLDGYFATWPAAPSKS